MPHPAQLHPLALNATVLGKSQTLWPSVLWNGQEAFLVDSGFPGQEGLIFAALGELGIRPQALCGLALTHQDLDHIGCAEALREASGRGDFVILSTKEEKPYIEGSLRPVKLTAEAVAQAMASLPPGLPEPLRAAFAKALECPPRARIDATLAEGDEVGLVHGGLLVLATPGHSPGHASYYHEESATLLAGDALRVEDGRLLGPQAELCSDYPRALASLQGLVGLGARRVICHHGGPWLGDLDRGLGDILDQALEPGLTQVKQAADQEGEA